MSGLNDFQNYMQVATCPCIYQLFFSKKTLENAKFIKTKITYHGALNWSYKATGKIAAISRMSRNNMLSNGAL